MERKAAADGFSVEPDEDAADEGSMLHARCLPGAGLDGLTGEQASAVEAARAYAAERTAGAERIQHELSVPLYRGKEQVSFGRLDVMACGFPEPRAAEVRVVDFKFGRSAIDRETAEWQMRGYALAALQYAGLAGPVHVWIYQAREKLEYYATYEYKPELEDQIARIIQRAQAVVGEPEAFLQPSYSACRYCTAKAICPAYLAEAKAVMKGGKLPGSGNLVAWSRILDWTLTASGFVKAAKERAKTIMATVKIPGFRLRERKVRVIRDPLEAASRLSPFLSVENILASLGRLPVTKVEEAYLQACLAQGIRAKDARVAFNRLLGDLTEYEVQEYIERDA